MDRKRCELSKVAKQYDLDITFLAITENGDKFDEGGTQGKVAVSGDIKSPQMPIVGNSVSVRDKDGLASHFESNSDHLTPKAREYFKAIAVQYGQEKMLTGQTDESRREEIIKHIAQRRIVLIGHTDDTGSSLGNATLSERRAKAVAGYLKDQGIPEKTLYFQGAGETLPIADNRTDAGRSSNRRVEIIEVTDEIRFKKYLETRQPNHQFYRPAEATAASVTLEKTIGSGSKVNKTSKPVAPALSLAKRGKPNSAVATTTQQVQPPAYAVTATKPTPVVNFGGIPYSPQNATLKVGALVSSKSSFSLISKAYADDAVALMDCTHDRPRAAGAVKSLRDGSIYKTGDHLPQLYGRTWAGDINGNLVVINHVAVLRDGVSLANLPELKIYAQYNPGITKKPEIKEEPNVNSYLVDQGVLYRMFPRGDSGLKCMDVLFGTDGATAAKGGKLVYTSGGSDLVADFKPQLQ